MSSKKKSLDLYLGEVFKQFISIKDDDFKRAQEVFKSVFEQVKQKMGEQCNYFKKYSSQVMYGGSVYDGIKITKLDEFDMDIVIRLPIHYGDGDNGIIIENEQPGFVKLKITNAFDNLDKQKEWENCHKVTREWRDSEKYFLQSKFRRWIHGIVQKALNVMDGKVTVHGVTYLLTYKESGPAYTLNVRNDAGGELFVLDVDLVPVIRFSFPRSPNGYRTIDCGKAKDWLVVPKPNKAISDHTLQSRCWRLSFQEQEREIIKGCLSLKMTIRLVKKVRDALEMKAIASYYIKTLFLWQVDKKKNDEKYWQGSVSFLFHTMIKVLYDAIKKKNVPYFWNNNNNLIEGLKPTLQKVYTEKLEKVLSSIEANDPDKLVTYILTKDELKEFKNTEFYQKQSELPNSQPQPLAAEPKIKETSGKDVLELSLADDVKALKDELDIMRAQYQKDTKIAVLDAKVNDLADRVSAIEDRLQRLELRERCQCSHDSENSISGLINGARDLTVAEPTNHVLIDFFTPTSDTP